MATNDHTEKNINWLAIEQDPRFQTLHRQKTSFLYRLLAFALLFFFALPISTAYFQHILNVKIWGVVNVSLVFALSQFIVAWAIAVIYVKRANRGFDQQAQAIVKNYTA